LEKIDRSFVAKFKKNGHFIIHLGEGPRLSDLRSKRSSRRQGKEAMNRNTFIEQLSSVPPPRKNITEKTTPTSAQEDEGGRRRLSSKNKKNREKSSS